LNRSGRPVRLYRFVNGSSKYLYCSGTDAVTWQAETYLPTPVGDEEIKQEGLLLLSEINIELPRDDALAALCLPAPPEGVIGVTIFEGHYGDNDFVVLWLGRVSTVSWPDDQRVRFACESVSADLKRPGLRARYQRICRHALYTSGCGVDPSGFEATGTAAAVSGTTITAAVFGTQADGWFIAGKIQAGDAVRMILTHAGTTITITAPITGLSVGDSFTAWAGCDHARGTCETKFDNLDKYGGFPWLPRKNPFSGDAIV
jgi:uncharacterized phage protein (TIGR02218 family)